MNKKIAFGDNLKVRFSVVRKVLYTFLHHKKRKEVIVTAVLAVVFLSAVANAVMAIKKRAKAKPPVMLKAPQAPAAVAPESPAPKEIEQKSLKWGRCPFSGKVYSAQGQSMEFKLTGILWDAQKPQAIINEKVVKPGDLLGNYLVVRIGRDTVTLSDGEKELELRLGRE